MKVTTQMLKIAFIVFTTTQESQFTLKNVSSCPTHLTNLETLYIKRYVSCQITHAHLLCAWVASATTARALSNVYLIEIL